MTDPFTTAVATAIATKAVAGVTEAGMTAFVALMRLVHRKLGAANRSPDLLRSAQAYPASTARRQALAGALSEAMATDRYFAEQLAELWRRVQEGDIGASRGSVLNIVAGDVDGNVLQSRDIHGDVSFG